MSINHDWYQTEQYVKVTVLLKNAVDKNYRVQIEENKLEMHADNYDLIVDLAHPINTERSTHKATPSKVEITLYKVTGERWNSLDRKIGEPIASSSQPVVPIGTKNWDKVAKEIETKEEDDPQGEAALRALFQKIYTDSNPEVRKAMNKSYLESEGTVLSTNWKEVAEKHVDVRPVDGTEYKSWKQN